MGNKHKPRSGGRERERGRAQRDDGKSSGDAREEERRRGIRVRGIDRRRDRDRRRG